MKSLTTLGLCSILVMAIGCAKDKNMNDYNSDQLQQNLAQIASVSGRYSGNVVSEIDKSNLGFISLQFQASTSVVSNSSTQAANQQKATVSGSLNFKSVNQMQVTFNNGTYDSNTGSFQVAIPLPTDKSKFISLAGYVSGDRWQGTISVDGQPDFGGQLDLVKNAPQSNTSAIEVGGARLQQMNKLDYVYVGNYKYNDKLIPVKMSFANQDADPTQSVYNVFSPMRLVTVNFDFTAYELTFNEATLDDRSETLKGQAPINQHGTQARANLKCFKYEDGADFGWDCQLQTKNQMTNLHLSAKK